MQAEKIASGVGWRRGGTRGAEETLPSRSSQLGGFGAQPGEVIESLGLGSERPGFKS